MSDELKPWQISAAAVGPAPTPGPTPEPGAYDTGSSLSDYLPDASKGNLPANVVGGFAGDVIGGAAGGKAGMAGGGALGFALGGPPGGVVGAILGGLAGLWGGKTLLGGVGGELGEMGYRYISDQDQKPTEEIVKGMAIDTTINAVTLGAGKLIKAVKGVSTLAGDTLNLVKNSRADLLDPKQVKALADGATSIKVTKAQAESINNYIKSVTPTSVMKGVPESMPGLTSIANKVFTDPEIATVIEKFAQDGVPVTKLADTLKATIDDLGQQLGAARAAITTPISPSGVDLIQDEIAKVIKPAVSSSRQIAQETASGFTKGTETVSTKYAGTFTQEVTGKFMQPIMDKAKAGTATFGDLIDQYKAVSDQIRALGLDDLTGKAAKAVGNPSGTQVEGMLEGLMTVKTTLKDIIEKVARDPVSKVVTPDVALANDLANRYAKLSEAQPFLTTWQESMSKGIAPVAQTGLKEAPIAPRFITTGMPAPMVAQAAGAIEKTGILGRQMPEMAGELRQSVQLPEALAMVGRGKIAPAQIPGGLALDAASFAEKNSGMAAPLVNGLGGLFGSTEAQSQELPPPRVAPRVGSPGDNLAKLAMALSKEGGPDAGAMIDTLQDAMSSGSEVEQNKIMGAILFTSPEARSLYEPGITSAKSEYGGVIANPQEKLAMVGQVRQLMKAGRLSTIEGSNFVEKLNTDTPFESVPVLLRRKTDKALAPLLDPYSFAVPQPPR